METIGTYETDEAAHERQITLRAVERMVASFRLAPKADELLKPVTIRTGRSADKVAPDPTSSRPRGYAGPRGPREMWTIPPASAKAAP